MARQSKSAMVGGSVPLYSISAAVTLVGLGILAAITTDSQRSLELLVALIVTTVPSLLAAAFAERSNRDIRNGVVQEKAREGAQEALDETGVTEVVELTHRGETNVLAMQALAKLLEANTAITKANTQSQEEEEGNTNDG